MKEACFEYLADLLIEPKAPVKNDTKVSCKKDDSENQGWQWRCRSLLKGFFDQIK